jgi:hypothetical protein
MNGPQHIEGLAIVSADGMIADAQGIQTPPLKLEADQKFFHERLNQADALAHGRHSGEGGPDAGRRRRLILTSRVASVAPAPQMERAVLWNPAGAPLEQAWDMLGLSGGLLVVIGGTLPFGLFLEHGYDVFHLSRASHARLPGGRPVFPGVPQSTPEDLLAAHHLKPGPPQTLDGTAGLTLVTWRR